MQSASLTPCITRVECVSPCWQAYVPCVELFLALKHAITIFLVCFLCQSCANVGRVQRLKAENEQLKQRLAKQKEQLAQAVVTATDPRKRTSVLLCPMPIQLCADEYRNCCVKLIRGICIVLADTTDEKKEKAEITSTIPTRTKQQTCEKRGKSNKRRTKKRLSIHHFCPTTPLRKLQAPLTTLFGGRGGGNDRCLQGMFSLCATQINDFLQTKTHGRNCIAIFDLFFCYALCVIKHPMAKKFPCQRKR